MHITRNIKLLFWFNFFSDLRLYAPIAIIYFTNITGSFALGMSIFSVVMICSALFEIPTGIFSDRIGRRKTIICGAMAAVVATFFYAISNTYLLLVVGAICEGLSWSFYSGNNEALLYDTLAANGKTDEYPRQYGKITSMFQVALAISGILGPFLAIWSFHLIMWLSVLTQWICLALALHMVEPTVHANKSGNIYTHLIDAFKNFENNKKLRLLTISGVIGYAFGEASYQFQAAFYATLWPLWAIGIAKTVANVEAAISFRYGHILLKKINPFKLLIVDNVYNRIVNSIAVIFPSVFSPVLMTSSGIFFGITSTAKNLLFQKEFTNEQRATMGSLGSFLGSIIFGIVAFLLGLTADKLSPAWAILLLNLFQLVNLYFYWKLFHHENRFT
ncbi:MFS transporter [soil metagenome]